MEKAKKEKELSPEEQKFQATCRLVGVWSLTELRFVRKCSLKLKYSEKEYIGKWLRDRGFKFGKYPIAEYLQNREKIWADATGPLVFKYKIRTLIPGQGVTKEWAVGTFTPRKDAFDAAGRPKIEFRGITRDEAEEIIDRFGMVLVEKNSDGWIYDTPDGKFLRQFGHKSANLSGANWIGPTLKED